MNLHPPVRNQSIPLRQRWKRSEIYKYWKYKYLTLLLLPAIVYFAIFQYGPIYGLQIAFKDYKFFDGIWGSPWVGFEHFRLLFERESFWEVFRNTVLISLYKFVFGFPAPIVFALLLNELKNLIFKRVVQTISYFPHFVSWVILAGIFTQFLSPSIGPINIVLKSVGLEPIYFLADPDWFRSVLVSSDVWKDLGWGTIIYLAALVRHQSGIVRGGTRGRRQPFPASPVCHASRHDTGHYDHDGAVHRETDQRRFRSGVQSV